MIESVDLSALFHRIRQGLRWRRSVDLKRRSDQNRWANVSHCTEFFAEGTEVRRCIWRLVTRNGGTLAPNRAMVFSILRLTLIGAGTRS
ncbi:hypothetical protein A471_18205 [Ectopseudomonas mendocina DLHK]|nr:hypothetical protein A471_18205 [Pseudomonas mendocina DLHK]MBA4245185.1 hypothetical protein [Pseudomonas sp.]